MQCEGEPVKRWRVKYGGDDVGVGDWDTATEAWAEYLDHKKNIRPVIDPHERSRYEFIDNGKPMDIVQFRFAVQAEQRGAEAAAKAKAKEEGTE